MAFQFIGKLGTPRNWTLVVSKTITPLLISVVWGGVRGGLTPSNDLREKVNPWKAQKRTSTPQMTKFYLTPPHPTLTPRKNLYTPHCCWLSRDSVARLTEVGGDISTKIQSKSSSFNSGVGNLWPTSNFVQPTRPREEKINMDEYYLWVPVLELRVQLATKIKTVFQPMAAVEQL